MKQSEALRLADYLESCDLPEAAAELRRLHEIERKYGVALQKGMEAYVEKWGGFRKTTMRGAEYDIYLSKHVAEFDAHVERVIASNCDLPTIEDAAAKLGKDSYELQILRAVIAKTTTP